MKEKPKLKLEDIKVESFITSMDDITANKMIGGTGGSSNDVEDCTAGCQSVCYTWCQTCPNTGGKACQAC